MEFVINEIFGDKPIYDWYAKNLKDFAKDKYGMEIEVIINTALIEERADKK